MLLSFVHTLFPHPPLQKLSPWRYFPYLSLKKIFNFFLIHVSYFFAFRKPSGNPFFISVEPTTACNLRCPQCPSGLRKFSRPTGNLKKETLEKILQEMHSFLIQIQFYFQGEPLIHPHMVSFIRMAHEHRIYTSLSTNAHHITPEKAEALVESGLDEIIISLDGMTQDNYARYRIGGNLEQVLVSVRNLREARRKLKKQRPYINLQFIVFRHNEQEIPMFIKFAKESCVDAWTLKGAQIYDLTSAGEWMPSNPLLRRYETKNGKWKIRNDLKNRCLRMWSGCVFTWDGSVVPCCFDKDASHRMGNIHQESWKNLWNGLNYMHFRNRLRKSRASIDICRNCSEGTRGVYLS